MNKEGLFPTTTNTSVGWTAGQFTSQFTNTLNNLDFNWGENYYMGYVQPEKIPTICKPFFYELDTSDEDNFGVKFTTGTPTTMANIGYVGGSSVMAYAYNLNNGSTVTSNFQSYRYVNNFYPEFYGFNPQSHNSIVLYFRTGIYDVNGLLIANNLNSTSQTAVTFTLENYKAFKEGRYTVTIQPFSQYPAVEIEYSDLVNGTFSKDVGALNYRVVISGFTIIPSGIYNGSFTTPNVPSITPFVYFDTSYKNSSAKVFSILNSHSRTSGETYAFNVNMVNGTVERIGTRFCGIEGEFYRSTFDFMASGSYLFQDGFYALRAGNYVRFFPIIKIGEIDNVLSLYSRVNYTTNPSYTLGFSYATDVSTNLFKGSLKTGNISDEAFKKTLEKWQYVDLETYDPVTNPQGSQENEYTEEDAPPYEPPSPDPEPSDQDDKDVDPEEDPGEIPDNEGEYQDDNRSWTITSPNNFITQYILSADQVSALGSTLWSSWLSENTDIWKNFMFSLDVAKDTGTFNISSVLNLIISLRVFPFDILNVVTQGGFKYSNGLYMGAGHTNFMPDSYIPTVTSIINSISCGTCVVKPSDGSTYDDFRDIYNTSVCAFLPFCGTVELNPADVMFKTLECVYYVEWQSGGCTAVIILHDGNAKYTVASKSGQLGFMLPITATNAGQVTGQFVSDAIHAASLIGNNIFSQTNAVGKSIIGALQGGAGGGLESNAISTSMGIARGNFNTALSLAGEANDMMARSGIGIPMLSGGAGMTSMMFPSKPYVQIRRGKYKVPKKYGHNVGYRSSTYQRVGSYTGFTVFSGVDVSGLDCTEEEQMKIKAIMESGIYVTNDK